MKITIITLFPKMIEGFLNESILKRAVEKNAVQITIVNLRDFAVDDYGSVDDRPYGGGAGMILRVEPIHKALQKVGSEKSHVILTSARGEVYNQKKAQELSHKEDIIIIAGHYEGVDERALQYIDEEISIGDFVLTGGELPACMIADSIVRLLPQVLKKEEATELESFFEVSIDELLAVFEDSKLQEFKKHGVEKVRLIEYPQYTRPQKYENDEVPPVLISGDPKKIHKWNLEQAYIQTKEKRPDLLNINS